MKPISNFRLPQLFLLQCRYPIELAGPQLHQSEYEVGGKYPNPFLLQTITLVRRLEKYRIHSNRERREYSLIGVAKQAFVPTMHRFEVAENQLEILHRSLKFSPNHRG